MSDSIFEVTTSSVAAADADVISLFYPVPGLGLVPINAFLLWSEEPVLVDTGPIVARDAYLEALHSLIDLDDLRWIYLTHADPDHVGCLHEVLAAAPRARLITTYLGLGRLGLYRPVPLERAYLLNPGQRLAVGDRELEAIAPVTFDAPETTPFVDSKTRTLFSSDGFGGLVSSPVENASEMTGAALRDGVVLWATIDSPWLRHLDAATLEAKLSRVRNLAAPIVLSSHLPPAPGMLDTLLDHIASARTQPAFVGPDQSALTEMLASLAARPEAGVGAHA